jgi:ubiquinone/menaquinone biosynthesis C-methylase UbiE
MIAPDDAARPGAYRTESLGELIGGVYDVIAPMMSLAVWHCSPLRYVDVQHRAVGRANPGGILLEAPIGTGVVLDRVLAEYHDVTVIGVDSSWKMLRKARKRFADQRDRVHLVRARPDNLPLADDVVQSIQSLNGPHAFNDRAAVWSEFRRVATSGAYISGSALIRGQELIADAVLDRYERWGILPMLRTGEFLVKEMHGAGFDQVHFETHGAVLFYQADNA